MRKCVLGSVCVYVCVCQTERECACVLAMIVYNQTHHVCKAGRWMHSSCVCLWELCTSACTVNSSLCAQSFTSVSVCVILLHVCLRLWKCLRENLSNNSEALVWLVCWSLLVMVCPHKAGIMSTCEINNGNNVILNYLPRGKLSSLLPSLHREVRSQKDPELLDPQLGGKEPFQELKIKYFLIFERLWTF